MERSIITHISTKGGVIALEQKQGRDNLTAQIHELIIFEGKKTSLACSPPLPHTHPRILGLNSDEDCIEEPENCIEEPENPFKMDDFTELDYLARYFLLQNFINSTACWRRYVGTWGITDGKLYLVRLEGKHRLIGKNPLFAEWVNYVLRIPRGEILHYVHMDFRTVHKEEILVKVENGNVITTRLINEQSKDFNKFVHRVRLGYGLDNML